MSDIQPSSLPRRVPGRGPCPPGERQAKPYPGMPAGASPCEPVGPKVPAGGWRESAPGRGEGYPPTGEHAIRALNDLLPTMAGAGTGDTSSYMSGYADWLRGMAR